MRPKSGLPKRKALRNAPIYQYGFRSHPATAAYRHPELDGNKAPIGDTVVSLFCGCGGLDLGFLGGFSYLGKTYAAHPFRIVQALDNDEKCVETYRLNIGQQAMVADLTKVPSADLPKARVLIGGFPCQDFSSSGPKVGFSGERGQLYKVLADYMALHRPEIVVAENVPHLRSLHGGQYLRTILRDFEECGYRFDVWNIHCPDYGLSQSRRRLFLVGVRNDLPGAPSLPPPSHIRSHAPIEVAIQDLEAITDETVTNQSQYFVATKASVGGGQGDHKNRRGELAYCIRANAKARIQFHYALDRRLTVRECARLQSFPDQFVFPFFAMNAMTQIGNAVPPIVAHHVAASIARYLEALDRGEAPGTARRSVLPEQLGLFRQAV